MAKILGATPRDLYEMTYRLINRAARVETTQGVWTGRLGSGQWRRAQNDGVLTMLQVDGEAGGREFPFSQVVRIALLPEPTN